MFGDILTFIVVYMLIGSIIAGKLLPEREFSGPKAAERFTVDWIVGWPLWTFLSLSFWLAAQFYEEDEDD